MAYCTENDLSRLLSSVGLDSFSDNDGDGEKDSDVINDCLEQAAEEIDMRLHERYTSEDLATSSIINRWATQLAAYFLCIRRGNPVPESFHLEVERILTSQDSALNRIKQGKDMLPGLAPQRGFAPSFSNLQIDRRYGAPIKVQHSSDRSNTSKNRPADWSF